MAVTSPRNLLNHAIGTTSLRLNPYIPGAMIDSPVPAMASREDAMISVHDDCLALVLTVRLEILLTVR